MQRRTMLVLAGVGAALVVAVPVGAFGLLAVTTHDAPERASLGAEPAASGGRGSAEGTWTVADVPTNFVGYRVRERLGPVAAPSDAVGRTSQVEGTATIAGTQLTALDMRVDMASLDSDSDRRDDFVRDEALETGRFPTAELHLIAPVTIGAPRDLHDVVDLSVPGDLTLRDVTHEVTFDVQARWNGPTIQAAGSTRIQRSDYDIDVSSRAGFNIDEEGTIEFELTFSPQGAAVDTPPPTLVDNPATPTDEGEVQPPCQSDDTSLTLDPPVLVSGSEPDADTGQFAIVSGAGNLTTVQTTHGLTGGVSWSPDGSHFVYSSSASLQEPRTLAIAGRGGGAPTPLPGLRHVAQPDWGPDGQILFVQTNQEANDSDIWVTDTQGLDPHVRAETPGIDADPRWSPNGRTVVFTTVDGSNNQEVVLVDSDGRHLRTVAGGPGYEYAPSFTPDGERVLFVRDGSIFVIGIDGEGERQLTDGPSDTNPTLSPDGDQIAFLRKRSLFVAGADGAGPACVVTNQSFDGGPRWHP